ncbi:cell division protein FtsQ/DivIB [Sulfurirhabdus autotrophica]|uniref:Cell division protein FtsQ n=1 Tax=Sulfurirhabdus autotrophica TaxID=1706046 RepID=A0A4R3XTL6_9PROT|nr:cell division protein FtsQ/DivIB [Sulfurirhabdus autotrophica]TCV83015.1 cell division protein FtsQ [Sulfurirhabdus autotrophica]
MWDKPQLLLWIANLFYAVSAILVLYAILFMVVHLPVFPLRDITVNGELKYVTREQVKYIVDQQLKGNFFTLDLKKARGAFEKLPWVRNVSMRRRWPDGLEVSLEEHVAMARWGNMALVNTKGELFQAASSDISLPEFVGQPGSEKEVAENYMRFKQQLVVLKLAPSQVILSPRRAWQLKLDNGMVVELGRDQVATRLTKFISVYDRTLGTLQRKIQYVDLRYPNGFAVRVPQQQLRGKEPASNAKPA